MKLLRTSLHCITKICKPLVVYRIYACRYLSHDKHKQVNKPAIGLKPGTSWSQIEHSTTEPMGK